MTFRFPYWIFVFILLLATSCTCNRNKTVKPKKQVTVETTTIKLKIHRFEQDWYAINVQKDVLPQLEQLKKQHPMMFDAFYNFVMEFPKQGNQAQQNLVVVQSIAEPYMKALYDSVMKEYPNLDFLEKELEEALVNYKSYFPEKPTPMVYTCIAAFPGFPAFTFGDSLLGICLENHLGADYVYYPNFFHNYQLYDLDKKFITIHAMNILATNNIAAPAEQSTLLDKMLVYGKILYFIECMLPNEKQENIIRYTHKQYEWCEKNKKQIWAYFLEKKLLYDTKPDKIKYVEEGPTTYGMPEAAPGKVGAWLGWQIIRSYVKNNPNITLKQLIKNNNSQQLLEVANFKP